jgi:hypothetical protein
MIVEHIRYRSSPVATESSRRPTDAPGALLDASPHCRRWKAARCADEPAKQIVHFEWDSAEGHLQGFRQSGDFKPFLEATGPFYDIEEMTHDQVTADGSAGSA